MKKVYYFIVGKNGLIERDNYDRNEPTLKFKSIRKRLDVDWNIYNRYELYSEEMWYEDEQGNRYKDKSDYLATIRDEKIKTILK